MHCSQYTGAIQELADGTLGPVRRAELQTHLDQCDDCRALADDLLKIRAAAGSLGPVRPAEHVWLKIAAQLRQEGGVAPAAPHARRGAGLLAIAAALVLAVGAAIYLVGRVAPNSAPATMTTTTPDDNAASPVTVQSIADDLTTAERHYQLAIAKLEEAATSDNGVIDPEIAAVLERNLQVIDQAIAESRTALQTEPQSAPARDSLFEALRRKVLLLQDTIALMNEMRKGNSAGAAQLADDGSKS